jgi:hypothetical protein
MNEYDRHAWVTPPETVAQLPCKCPKKHRSPAGWVRCAVPALGYLDGRKGRLVVIHWCRIPSAVLVDSLPEAEKVMNWVCCGPCDRHGHQLFAVTRKPLPHGVNLKEVK